MEPEDCLEYSDECSGPVEYRWPGHGEKNYLRCEFHGERRLEKAEQDRENYPDSPIAPSWFDPDYAGERWDDDY